MIIAVSAVVQAVFRIIEIAGNTDVIVHASFVDTDTVAPIGPDGAEIPVTLDTALVTIPQLPADAMGAAVLEQVVFALTVLTVVTCLVLLSRSILRGRVFGASNTRLVATAGIVALVGFGLAPALSGAAASSALYAYSEGAFTGTALFQVDVFPFVLSAFAFAAVGTAFTVGARLQRETEGLV